MLYPLKFNTIFKDKLWGGNKIKTVLGKDFGDLPNCGETWEISGVEGNISVVSEGALKGRDLKSLIQTNGDELLGKEIHKRFGTDFPLLIKFIDADQDLSIQVHPDDDLAQERHKGVGKTEMWYVLQADQGASLICGFNQPTDRKKYLEKFESGKLMDILNKEKVTADDVFLLPAGRVHTIGKGLLIAEIQQTSDITYRIYDFDRVDDEGNKRELHVEQALDAINYEFLDQYKTSYRDIANGRSTLVICPYFTTNKLNLDQNFSVSLPDLESFKIYICIDGEAMIATGSGDAELVKGDVVLVPAVIKDYQIQTKGQVTLLESYIGG
jgi:mannose-6-phosphate isomerase